MSELLERRISDLLQSSPQVFQDVLELPDFYMSDAQFMESLARFETAISSEPLPRLRALEAELALVRVKRLRFAVETSRAMNILTAMEGEVSTDSMLNTKFRIVRAEFMLLRCGRTLEARSELEELDGLLRGTEHHFLYALVANALSMCYMILVDESRAEDYFQVSIGLFRRYGAQLQYAYALNNYGVLKKKLCQYADADRMFRKSLREFESLGAIDGQSACYTNLGIVKIRTGEWHAAERYLEKAETLSRAYVSRIAESDSSFSFGIVSTTALEKLLVQQRRFGKVESLLIDLLAQIEPMSSALGVQHSNRSPTYQTWRSCLAHEFLGEIYSEIRLIEEAAQHLDLALEIATVVAPQSDLMAETMRRRAQLALLQNDLGRSRKEAIGCLSLCRKIGDKYELGAALRILGEIYVQQGLARKAVSAFEASINTLKSIGECYELMRSCIAYSEFLIDAQSAEADIYLLEAKQLCKKLEIDYYMAKIMLLSSKYAHINNDYLTARAYLKKAEEIADKLQDCDRKKLTPEIRNFYKTLEKSILQTSMESSRKLKSIGKIYEDARFPIEELKPELAVEVALNVGASQLFLVRKKNKGFRVPIKYNISAEDAKQLIRFQLRTNEGLFEVKDPTIIPLPTGKTLVCVPGQTDVGYVLCTLIEQDRSFSPRELEFLFASVEAMERVAEEYAEIPPCLDMDDFMDGGEEKLTHPGGHFQEILTLDPETIKLIRLAERASETNVPILLEGETGVGKELFAHAIHTQSPRKHKQFVAVNAGGVPLNLLESQLFGHIKGAFTDAVTDRHGLIEEARGGTIFFDEVGEMAEELQVKLLRLLENGEFRRLGENALRMADVRVVSATNKDLERRVKEGLFREDLYYRLATVRFRIPPLRNRKRDIEFLVRHFINDGLVRIGKPRRRINVDVKALEAFEIYNWPGNVRELKNEILRALSLIGQGEVIRFGMLSEHVKTAFQSKGEDGGLLAKRVDRYERRLILKALEDNEWNRIRTAEQIGIPRTTLLFKMKRLNILA